MTDIDEGFDPDDYDDPEPRLPRGYLSLDTDLVCQQFSKGEITLEEGKYMTPYTVGTILVDETDGARKRPSSGAIAGVFSRWEDAGYAEFRREPFAFLDFTAKGKEAGSWNQFQDMN